MTRTRSPYQALTALVDRVNDPSNRDAAATIAYLEAEIARLQGMLENAQRRIDEQALYIKTLKEQPLPRQPRTEQTTATMHNGRPVLSLHEVATRLKGYKTHKSAYAAAWRMCNSGAWQAVQLESRQWLVYADQPLIIGARGKRKRT